MAANPNISWRVNERGELKAFAGSQEVIWYPQPGGQAAFLQCPIEEVLLTGPRGSGKGLRVGEPVLTPSGWRSVESLVVGDGVCTPDGKIAGVIGVFPQGIRPVYEFTFDDGARTYCDDNHIWPIRMWQDESPGRSYRLMPVPEVFRRFHLGQRLTIPTMSVPPEFGVGAEDVAVDPYILGLLLGDGYFGVRGLTVEYGTVDDELAQAVLKAQFVEGKPDNRNETLPYRRFSLSKKTSQYLGLENLGVLGKRAWEKEIPLVYKNGSSKVRLAILQGLLDTDGCCDLNRVVMFTSCSKQLALDVQQLVWSLGGKTRFKERHGHTKRIMYSVNIQAAGKFPPFRLHRKAERVNFAWKGIWRRLVDIKECPFSSTVCIKLDSPDGLFITRDFIVTHNTEALLFDYAQHINQGFGADWRGIMFRRTFPELDDVVSKTRKWFPRIWPKAQFNIQKMEWTWPDGEMLLFRHMMREEDYFSYHGSSYPWVSFEELTTWPDPGCYTRMFSCCRSGRAGMPRKIRATTNPYGCGMNWVKRRFRLPMAPGCSIGEVIRDSKNKAGDVDPPRVAINASLSENKILLFADPLYLQRIKAAARNPSELAAWVDGSWTEVGGGIVDDIWDENIHIVPNVEADQIPKGWRINRAYDHGQSKPFSVGWWLESNGEPIETEDGRLIGSEKGDLIRLAEFYGWNGEPNEGLRMTARDIARGIKEREIKMGIRARVCRGPADTSIFAKYDGTKSVAGDMMSEGISWDPIDKSGGSREQGWQKLRDYLKNAIPGEDGTREGAGLFVCARNSQFLRTVPCLPRDQRKIDDVDSDAEDHIADECRYRLRWTRKTMKVKRWR
jgi:hypothetical protein